MQLHVRRFTSAATRSTPAQFADPAPWEVRGVAPGAMVEPGDPNRDRSDIAWTVYADASDDVPTERDRVDFLGDTYEVAGRPADWTHGPWENPAAGVVVELKRTEG